ncbi:hypothetical protein BG004_004639 [Podila humilis]|nr:hypothetical protein BG004_004639 [Podila humilis]
MPKDYYGRGDYSDDESNSRSRDKFRRERSPDKDDFGRDKRRRKTSASPEERDRRPKRNRSSSKDLGDDPVDRYIPNYDRDGYNPAPRYGRPEPYGSRYDSHGGYGGDYRGQRRRDDYDMEGSDGMYGGQDMPSGWGNSDRVEDPMKLDHLITFKQYCEYLRNLDRASHRYKRYTDEELQTRYGTYREEFNAKQLAGFFEAEKSHAWFLEKYHPELSQSRTEESLTLKRSLFDAFIVDLAAGKYDQTTCDEAAAKKLAAKESGETKEEKSADGEASVDKDGDVKLGGSEDGESMLYLRTVLPTVTRDSILERCKKIDGFVMLSLSEPHPLKELQRTGWIKFKSGTDLEEALKIMSEPATEDFQVSAQPHRATRARYTHEIANTDARISADYQLAVALAKVCDENLRAAATEEDPEPRVYDGSSLLESRLSDVIKPAQDTKMDEGDTEEGAIAPVKVVDERQALDLYIEYLRQVHLFCYYCGGDSDNVQEFNRKCSKHFRNPESKVPTSNTKGAVWVKNLEHKINLRLNPPTDDEIVKLGGKSLEKNVLKFLQGKTQQDEPTKWRCKICTKPFRGEEFVHKHIRTKHPDEVKAIENSIQLFNNYILDPNHISPSAQQQQQPQQQMPPNGFGGYGMSGGMFGGPPMPMSFMPGHSIPFMNPGMSPMPQFPAGFIPPSFSASAAMAGTPLDKIPRIGFDFAKRRTSKDETGADKARIGGSNGATKQESTPPPARSSPLMLDPRSRMTDPRKVKSYVDLDAPAEGDIDANKGKERKGNMSQELILYLEPRPSSQLGTQLCQFFKQAYAQAWGCQSNNEAFKYPPHVTAVGFFNAPSAEFASNYSLQQIIEFLDHTTAAAAATTTATATTTTTNTTDINASTSNPSSSATFVQGLIRPTPTSLLLAIEPAAILLNLVQHWKDQFPDLGLRLKKLNHLSLTYWDDDHTLSDIEVQTRKGWVDQAQRMVLDNCPGLKRLEEINHHRHTNRRHDEFEKERRQLSEEFANEWDLVLYSVNGRTRSKNASYELVEVKRWEII